MRFALKFAYLGDAFHGYQRQPGLRTVEGDILGAMHHLGIARDPLASRFQSASRTDVGVSALGNVVALDTEFRPKGICRALNSRLEDVWFWAAAPVGTAFNPRHARERWYRYHLPSGLDLQALHRAARVLQGRHDFRAFTREQRSTVREVTSITVSRGAMGPVADFRAPSFLWNLVRRLVGSMEAYAQGNATLAEIRAALAPGRPVGTVAPAAPLILMDILYDEPFAVEATGDLRREVERRLTATRARADLLASLVQRALSRLPRAE